MERDDGTRGDPDIATSCVSGEVEVVPETPHTQQSPLTVKPRSTCRARTKRATFTRPDSVKRALGLGKRDSADPRAADPEAVSVSNEGVVNVSRLVAQVAHHGPLYERVSFHNLSTMHSGELPTSRCGMHTDLPA